MIAAAVEKPGVEDHLQQFAVAEHRLARLDQALRLGLGADALAVDAAAVVA